MHKIKMPWNFRLQSFVLVDGRLVWTSASKTLWQKLVRLVKGVKSPLCNTSEGYTLPCHGQYVKWQDGKLLCDEDLSKSPNLNITSSKFLQGVSGNYAVFGCPDKDSIDVYNLRGSLKYSLEYKDYSKWWWKYWEAEGIFSDGKDIYIGISVKSKFGFIANYIKKVS